VRRVLLFAMLACAEGPAPPAERVTADRVTAERAAVPARGARPTVLWVGGDVLMSEAIRDHARTFDAPDRGFAEILAPMAALWNADPRAFVLVNLELPITARRRNALDAAEPAERGPTPRHLNGPTWLPQALARSGVDAVMLANNHALDQDSAGLAETIERAEDAGLLVTGAGRTPHRRWPITLGDEGAEMAVLTFFDGYFLVRGREPRYRRDEYEPPPATLSPLDENALTLIREAADTHDAVVVVVHVLGELQRRPKDRWRWWAERLVDAGASAILVHGTHVVLPVERVEGVPIAWGLGNLVSDMGRLANPRRRDRGQLPKARSAAVREALVARVALEDGRLDLRFVAGWMHDDRYVRWNAGPPWSDGEIRFGLLPMSSCADAPAPIWDAPAPLDEDLRDWVARRRDHVLEVTGLVADACALGEASWLRLPD